MTAPEIKKFGFLRSLVWPIHRSEAKKVIVMVLLLFLLCVSYSILRNLKDTVILTAKNSGAEVIPFIKVWGMLPATIAATWFYTRLTRFFRRENVFYVVISGFIAYFLLFAFVFYPNSEKLHLEKAGEWLTQMLPHGFNGLIALIRNWSFTSFYVISELWSVLVIAVLFWGFANESTEVHQAKRTYGLMHIGANIAPIIAGVLSLTVSNAVTFSFLAIEGDHWGQTIRQIILLIACLGVLAMGLHYWIYRTIITPQENLKNQGSEVEGKKEKLRLSMRDSLRYIASSKYLIALAIIVLGYNISINLTDILWKEQLRRFFSDPNDMLEHMNKITVGVGILATLGGILFSLMVTRLGWTFIAILTPFVMTMMGIGFFTFMFCGDLLSAFALSLLGVPPFALTVYCGSLQNCLSKACKYSVFDASKELAFLPLDSDSKMKGKAAIDGLGSGIGKSGSSLTYQGFIILLGSVAASTPYIAIILLVVLSAWIFSIFVLGKKFKQMTVVEQKPAVVLNEVAETAYTQ